MIDESTNPLVPYTSRDYNSLLEAFKDIVPKLTDLWTPESDADPGVVLGKYIASVADMLGINLDWAVNEMYAPTVSQRKNAEKLFDLIGYNLGYFTAARTEVTFTNNLDEPLVLDFGFNGSNFCTLNAYTDIANQSRVITYNILPRSSSYGDNETSNTYSVTTDGLDVFVDSDIVTLGKNESVTRVAIEGDIRSHTVSVQQIKDNNYVIPLSSQHVDTTAVWVMAKASQTADEFIQTRWIQCASPSEFITPEPRFAVTFDSYSNAQIQISNYLNQLENYDQNWITVYWIDCSGVSGCVGENVLSNLLFAKTNQSVPSSESGDLGISNLSNTIELPHTYTVTGKSPETAKEAYYNSRNYINTWDSLVTLPDYTRFLKREKGVDAGIVIDCQKALEINLAIYKDENLTAAQKKKKYITKKDFPPGNQMFDWSNILNLEIPNKDLQKNIDNNPEILANESTQYTLKQDFLNQMISSNFKTYTAMCFAVHNDFKASSYGQSQTDKIQIKRNTQFIRYKPPARFIDGVIKDFKPLQAMSVEMEFGYLRVFNFYVVGTITPKKPVSKDTANILVETAKEALQLYFAPSNFDIGRKPTIIDLVNVVETCDSNILHFDPGAPKTDGIVWYNCDIEYFNPISIARYLQPDNAQLVIRVNPEYIV